MAISSCPNFFPRTKYFVDTDKDGELDEDEEVVFEHYSGKYVYSYASKDGQAAVSGTWGWVNGDTNEYDEYSIREESRSANLSVTLDGTQYALFLSYTRTRYVFSDDSKKYNYTSAYVTVDGVEIEDAVTYMNTNW